MEQYSDKLARTGFVTAFLANDVLHNERHLLSNILKRCQNTTLADLTIKRALTPERSVVYEFEVRR